MTPYYEQEGITIYHGDCREALPKLPDGSVQCVVTSPPYWGLRDYECDSQIGLETTPEEYIETMVGVFREVRRVLRSDGTLWLNMGDSYWNGGGEKRDGGSGYVDGGKLKLKMAKGMLLQRKSFTKLGLKPKDIVGIPWRLALALQADGWWLRQDIIWYKPNPKPESVTDRCAKAHEYLFLLSKSARYHYEAEAIAEPVAETTIARLAQPTLDRQAGSFRQPGKTNGPMKAVGPRFGGDKYGDNRDERHRTKSGNVYDCKNELRNRRSVWTITTQPFSQAHFATFPPKLVEPCIKAGCPAGGMVLDPFAGSGVTAMVAKNLGCKCINIELNEEYLKMQTNRLAG